MIIIERWVLWGGTVGVKYDTTPGFFFLKKAFLTHNCLTQSKDINKTETKQRQTTCGRTDKVREPFTIKNRVLFTHSSVVD